MPRTGGIADLSMYQSMLASLACACAPPMTSEPRACAACRFTVHAARCAIAPHARVGERTRSRIVAPCAPRISPSPIGGMRTGDARARRHMRDVQRPAKSSGMRMAFCEIGDARASPLRFDGGLSECSALFRKVVKFHDMTC